MIDVYTWPTPNGHKVHIMLEETGLKYRIHAINIRKGDQFKPAFLKISPKPFQRLRERPDPVCNRALHQRSEPADERTGQAPRRIAVRRV